MNKALNDKEYYKIISPYLNDCVMLLKNIPHHDTNRLEHCLKVSYKSYKVSQKLGLNSRSVAVAGLLHDLYFNSIYDCRGIKEKVSLFTNGHPAIALANAQKMFTISTLEENIILSHMWPASKYFPKYRESFVVNIVDKFVSLKEFSAKNRYKVSYNIGVYFILFTYFLFQG